MTPEEFRVAGHALIDWIADHRERVPDLPVAAQVRPGEVRDALPTSAPDSPEDFAAVLADLDRIVVPGVTQTQHPGFYGWFPSNASLASVLGDIASGGIGALGITWQSAPALTEVEQVVTDWLRELCGLSPEWKGAIQDTASTACLVAMLAARERASDGSEHRGGLQGLGAPLVAYTSPQAHSSVPKSVLLAGYGADNLRYVDVDPVTYAMDPGALRRAMADDAAAGRVPAVVVAAVGTTGTTAMDPVRAIVEVAREHGAWVHVDAAMAGSAMLLPEMRHLFDGADDADSIAWNPHKWMGTVLDTSLLYVRDVDHLVSVMSTTPSYLRAGTDDAVVQYKDWGIPLGRRFRALKLWFHLRLDGVEAIRAPAAPRPRERPVARRAGGGRAGVAGARAGRPADRVPAPRARRVGGGGPRRPHPGLGRRRERHRAGVPRGQRARRPVDGAGVGRCRGHRARRRRGPLGPRPGRGGGARHPPHGAVATRPDFSETAARGPAAGVTLARTTRRSDMAEVRHTRSHAIAGLTLGLGAVLVMLGTLFPVFHVTGGRVPHSLWSALGLRLRDGSVGFDGSFRTYVVLTAVWALLMGLALVLTRVKYVGPVWRVAALVALAATSFIAFVLWLVVLDPMRLLGRPVWFASVAPALVGDLRGATVDAAVGLWLFTVGSALGVLATLVPAFYTHRTVKTHTSARGGLEPGWYPAPNSRSRTRYWDGEKWTVGA